LAGSVIQVANSNICPGEVVTEFAINVVGGLTSINGASLNINLGVQPRTAANKCAVVSVADRLCFDTSRAPPGLFPSLFGDGDNDVCVSDFLLTGNASDFPPGAVSFVTSQIFFPLTPGDILDTAFSINTRTPASCPAAPFTGICSVFHARQCFASDCGEPL
jgi:hypothetical protein